MGRKVAVVGSGWSGIAALWALKSTDHEVHLFEAESRLGGHNHTVSIEGLDESQIDVDTDFIVMNTTTCPNIIRFLDYLCKLTRETDSTFSISRDEGNFEWAGPSFYSMIAQKSNLLDPDVWRLIFDIARFNEFALDTIKEDDEDQKSLGKRSTNRQAESSQYETVGEFLEREKYSLTFREDYLLPIAAGLWSVHPDTYIFHFPVVTLIRCLWHHGLLTTISKKAACLTVSGGISGHTRAVLSGISHSNIHLKSKVTALSGNADGSLTLTANGKDHSFDHVILAIHGNEALRILQPTATTEEENILSGFKTKRSIGVLHSDASLMPHKPIAWSARNYLGQSRFPPSSRAKVEKVCVSYWMNTLQDIPEDRFGTIVMTSNPLYMPDPTMAHSIWEYSQPLYDAGYIRSQSLLPSIQNTRNISYCGGWTGYNLPEDAFNSGLLTAVNHLGAKLPVGFADPTGRTRCKPVLTWRNHALRILLLAIQLVVLMFSSLSHALTARHATKQQKSG